MGCILFGAKHARTRTRLHDTQSSQTKLANNERARSRTPVIQPHTATGRSTQGADLQYPGGADKAETVFRGRTRARLGRPRRGARRAPPPARALPPGLARRVASHGLRLSPVGSPASARAQRQRSALLPL